MLAEANASCDLSIQAGFYMEKAEEKDDGTQLSPIGRQTRARSIHTEGQKGCKKVTFGAPGDPRLGGFCPAGGSRSGLALLGSRLGGSGELVRTQRSALFVCCPGDAPCPESLFPCLEQNVSKKTIPGWRRQYEDENNLSRRSNGCGNC